MIFPRHAIKVAFLDVGQGDTIVISSAVTSEAIVVDCADAEIVIEYLLALGIKYLRGIVITHLHADHYRGVPQLLDNCRRHLGSDCDLLLYNQVAAQSRKKKEELLNDKDGHSTSPVGGSHPSSVLRTRTTAHRNLREWTSTHKNEYGPASLGAHKLPLEGALWSQVELLHPYHADLDELESTGLNDTSVVLKVYGPGSSALLTGDLERDGFKKLQSAGVDLKSEVLKVPHHGGWNADPSLILDVVKPSIAVISVGSDGQRYNHPGANTFDRIRERTGARLLCTQGTTQCGVGNRAAVVASLRAKDKSPPVALTGQPCAGTVVVELGDTARVVWPEQDVHLNVIQSHFPGHKCTLAK